MNQLWLTVTLAVFAFLTAIHGTSDKKSVATAAEGDTSGWHKRITGWGLLRIALMSGTLAFAILNGLQTYRSSQASKESSDKQQAIITDQAKKLADAQGALDDLKAKLASAGRTIDLAEFAVRMVRGFQGNYNASMSPLSSIDYDLTAYDGSKYSPKRGDRLEYSLVCRNGRPPDVKACSSDAFGFLDADGDKFPITQLNGQYVFQGTRSTGGEMTFEAAKDCTDVRVGLENSYCDTNGPHV